MSFFVVVFFSLLVFFPLSQPQSMSSRKWYIWLVLKSISDHHKINLFPFINHTFRILKSLFICFVGFCSIFPFLQAFSASYILLYAFFCLVHLFGWNHQSKPKRKKKEKRQSIFVFTVSRIVPKSFYMAILFVLYFPSNDFLVCTLKSVYVFSP